MTPLPDSIANPEVVPSLVGAAFRVAAALILLGGAAWAFLRWRGRGPQSQRQIRVLDRTALTRGAGLAVVAVADRRLLLSVSSDGARLITALDEPAPRAFEKFLDESAGSAKESAA